MNDQEQVRLAGETIDRAIADLRAAGARPEAIAETLDFRVRALRAELNTDLKRGSLSAEKQARRSTSRPAKLRGTGARSRTPTVCSTCRVKLFALDGSTSSAPPKATAWFRRTTCRRKARRLCTSASIARAYRTTFLGWETKKFVGRLGRDFPTGPEGHARQQCRLSV
jgi:hypothetical protein